MSDLREKMKMESIVVKIAQIFGETPNTMESDALAQIKLEMAGAMMAGTFDGGFLNEAYQIIEHT